MQESDLTEIVASETNSLTTAEIEEILADSESQDQDIETTIDEPENTLTTKTLAKILNMIHNAIDEALSQDPILTRSLKFTHELETAMGVYKELYQDYVRSNRMFLIILLNSELKLLFVLLLFSKKFKGFHTLFSDTPDSPYNPMYNGPRYSRIHIRGILQ